MFTRPFYCSRLEVRVIVNVMAPAIQMLLTVIRHCRLVKCICIAESQGGHAGYKSTAGVCSLEELNVALSIWASQLRPPGREKCGGVFSLLVIVQDLKQTIGWRC